MFSAEQLSQLLAHYVRDNHALVNAWHPHMVKLVLPEGKAIIRAGEQPRSIYILAQGVVRYYYTTHEGKEWNKAFYREVQIIGSLSAELTKTPCRYTIESLEPCVLYSTPIECLREISKEHRQLDELIYKISQQLFVRNEEREAMLLVGDAEAKYQWLLRNENWLIERGIKQYHLASYLGIDGVSLSRIKKKLKDQSS